MKLPLTLSAASGVPFYRQIVDRVADLVRAGSLPPGTLLPSVRDLAVDLRVSLITVRRAYADLEAAGLLVRKQGQGTFVAEGVGEAARVQARTHAREALGAAVQRARTLGLDDAEIRDTVAGLLAGGRMP
jgi:GntR family transcriptional regulator